MRRMGVRDSASPATPNSRCTMLCSTDTANTPSSMAIESWPANDIMS